MKKYIIPVAAFIAGMAIVPSVFADSDADVYTTWNDLYNCLASTEVEEGPEADTNTVTCKLGNDVTGTTAGDLTIGSGTEDLTIVLDLQGHKLTLNKDSGAGTKLFNVTDANFVIKNGTIDNADEGATAVIGVAGKGDLTIGEGVTIEGKGGVSVAKATEGVVAINGATLNTKGAAVTVSDDAAKAVVNLNNANITSEVGRGISQNAGKVNINGGKVEGAAGIYIKGGELTVKDATVAGTGEYKEPKATGTDNVTGAAMQIESTSDEKNVKSINIEHSILTSAKSNVFHVYGNTSHVKEDLGTFALKNVRLTSANADSPIMKKSGEHNTPAFAEYSVDGKGVTEVALAELTSYDTYDGADQGTDEPTTDAGEEAENPNTADTIATYITIATVALLGLGATAFVAKKSNR